MIRTQGWMFAVCCLAAAFLASPPAPASGSGTGNSYCACCAEPGTWYTYEQEVDEGLLGELNGLRFASVARTFLTAAGFDGVEGITNPSESYTLTRTHHGRRWDLKFKDARGRSGTLSFSVPASATTYGVDTRDGRASAGGGPLLYKELRFEGALTGTGIFAAGVNKRTRFRLVLQGRGNNCTNAADYKGWTLRVFEDAPEKFAFYGQLARPGARRGD